VKTRLLYASLLSGIRRIVGLIKQASQVSSRQKGNMPWLEFLSSDLSATSTVHWSSWRNPHLYLLGFDENKKHLQYFEESILCCTQYLPIQTQDTFACSFVIPFPEIHYAEYLVVNT
jgi:hypothetical protein